jgi:hypothetical protein
VIFFSLDRILKNENLMLLSKISICFSQKMRQKIHSKNHLKRQKLGYHIFPLFNLPFWRIFLSQKYICSFKISIQFSIDWYPSWPTVFRKTTFSLVKKNSKFLTQKPFLAKTSSKLRKIPFLKYTKVCFANKKITWLIVNGADTVPYCVYK